MGKHSKGGGIFNTTTVGTMKTGGNTVPMKGEAGSGTKGWNNGAVADTSCDWLTEGQYPDLGR